MKKEDKKIEDLMIFSGQYEDCAQNQRVVIPEGIEEISENAFRDCIAIIRKESQAKNVSTDDDLMAFRDKLKERKGTKK